MQGGPLQDSLEKLLEIPPKFEVLDPRSSVEADGVVLSWKEKVGGRWEKADNKGSK